MGSNAGSGGLAGALASIEPVVVDGIFWRHGNPRYALDEVSPNALAASRWQREGDPAGLHLSDSEDAVWVEHAKATGHVEGVDRAEVRRRLGQLYVNVRAIDLRDADVQKALDLDEADLTSDDPSTCWRIADAARTLGIEALLAPSAAVDGATTLVVLPAGLRHGTVHVVSDEIVAPP